MESERFAQLKLIVLRAAVLPAEERKACLDEECGKDLELRHEAESILAHGAEPSEILKMVGIVPEAAADSGGEAPPIPAKIAEYRIVRKLGEGGMGVVYEAEQESPRRRVALKVVRSGTYLDKHRIRLFQREIQALGRLKHPGIADIHESGRTEEGEHFFVMELVSGVPLDEYLADNPIRPEHARADIRARLDLFRQICHGISYAHQRGVIHRDLKPSNIFVVSEEGSKDQGSTGSSVQVKILDFGLARITDADVSMTTMMTEVGKIQGTLSYMSPEQARGNPDEIDVRSDVYSLGVILYEMLTGELPYDVRCTMVHDAVRVILEQPPRKPSTMIRTLGGDVETIVLKALEKDPGRRYQSVSALGEDVERYLADQPILARPPSTVYQLRKLVARHKALFGALAAVFAVLAGGLVASTTLYLRAENARAEAMAVTEFLSETLAAVDPWEGQGSSVTILEMLDMAEEKIEEAFSDQPLVEAALRATIGNTYSALGQYPTAEPHLETALAIRRERFGEEHPDTLASMNDLVLLYLNQGRYEEAEPLNTRTLEIRRHLLGEEHPKTLQSMNNLGWIHYGQGQWDDAEKVWVKTIELRRRVLGKEHLETLKSMDDLGMLYKFLVRWDEAQPLLEKVLELYRRTLGEEHPTTVQTMSNLGSLYYRQAYFDKAEPLVLRVLELNRSFLGDEHPATVDSMNSVGVGYWGQGRYDEAEPYIREASEIAKRVLGEEHPNTLDYLWCLAYTYANQGRYDEAEKLLVRVHEVRRRVLGEENPYTVDSMDTLGWVYMKQGRYDEAEELFVKVLPLWRRIMQPGFHGTGRTLMNYGKCLLKKARYSEAETVLLEAHEILAPTYGSMTQKEKIETLETLVELYDAWGKPEKAAEWQAKLVEQEAETSSQQSKSASE